MAILWAGNEDMDFPNAPLFPTVDTTAGTFRPAYARYGMYNQANGPTQVNKSDIFSGGAVTSCWVTARGYHVSPNSGFDMPFGQLLLGLVKSGTTASGIWVAISSTDQEKLAIVKYDGTTVTQLVAEGGASFLRANLVRYDLQVINYGASGTVNVYANGSSFPIATYTGNIAVPGVTNVDMVAFGGNNPVSFAPRAIWSEFIVADEDTRAFVGLATLSPTGPGTTDQWTGAYTDVNETVVNDAAMISTNTVSQDEQFNITDVPSGDYFIKAVVVAARSTGTTGAAATKIALGFKSGASVAVGTSQLTTTAWVRLMQVFAQNPVTSTDWLLSEMNALQVNLRSGS